MKKIAVFTHKLTIEYALQIIQGIQSFFSNKEDVQLFVAQTTEPHYIHGIYEYQYWASAELLKNKDIDLYIIITSSYCTYQDAKGIADMFSNFTDRPIISVSSGLPLENSKYTSFDVENTYYKVIRHLKIVHHCHNIGFMSSNLTGSTEGEERLSAFKKAMERNNLKVQENWILNGTFDQYYAETLIPKLYKSKKDIPYDALICANDLMAMGAMESFQKLGVKIPRDLKIVGYDDTSHASTCRPTLSTINQGMFSNGYKSGELAYKILQGHAVPDKIVLPTQIRYRQSCGCIRLSDNRNRYRLKSFGRKIECYQNENKDERIGIDDISNIYRIFDPAKSNATLRDVYYSIQNNMSRLSFDSFTLCLYETPLYCSRQCNFSVPAKASLKMHINEIPELSFFEEETNFYNPQELLIPQKAATLTGKNVILQPLFSGETQYGYIICAIKNHKYAVNCVYLKILNSIITSALELSNTISRMQTLDYERKQLQMSNSDLKRQSITDELTQLLNRRGFMELGQKMITLSKELNNKGLVFFCDMDGLKKINDSYGHAMGDKAIMLQAQTLNFVFRKTDIIGRLGGDEFAVIAPGTSKEFVEIINKKLLVVNKKLSAENDLPFELSMSIAAVEFSEFNFDIDTLLNMADEQMYLTKKQKKSLEK